MLYLRTFNKPIGQNKSFFNAILKLIIFMVNETINILFYFYQKYLNLLLAIVFLLAITSFLGLSFFLFHYILITSLNPRFITSLLCKMYVNILLLNTFQVKLVAKCFNKLNTGK